MTYADLHFIGESIQSASKCQIIVKVIKVKGAPRLQGVAFWLTTRKPITFRGTGPNSGELDELADNPTQPNPKTDPPVGHVKSLPILAWHPKGPNSTSKEGSCETMVPFQLREWIDSVLFPRGRRTCFFAQRAILPAAWPKNRRKGPPNFATNPSGSSQTRAESPRSSEPRLVAVPQLAGLVDARGGPGGHRRRDRQTPLRGEVHLSGRWAPGGPPVGPRWATLGPVKRTEHMCCPVFGLQCVGFRFEVVFVFLRVVLGSFVA